MKKTDGQATASNQEAVEMVDVGTQTEIDEDVKPADAGTQADLLQPPMTETGVQTDTPSDSEVHTSLVTNDSATPSEVQNSLISKLMIQSVTRKINIFCVRGTTMRNFIHQL